LSVPVLKEFWLLYCCQSSALSEDEGSG